MDFSRMAVPPSLTAFTSRRSLSYDKSHCCSHGSGKTDHGSDSEATCYNSDSAISDSEEEEDEDVLDEDQWEDDPDYDEHGGLVFRRTVAASTSVPKVSGLSQLLQQQRDAGIPVGTVAGMTVVGTCGAASPVPAPAPALAPAPDPLRSHPTSVSCPLPASRLRRAEVDTELHASILDENNVLFLVRKRASRHWTGRWEGDDKDKDTDMDILPVRRTQSAPNMRRRPSPTLAEAEDMVVRGGVRDIRSFRFRQFEYVDDYEAPPNWSWDNDYHTRGW